jgi:carboxyl-terminal processing protease
MLPHLLHAPLRRNGPGLLARIVAGFIAAFLLAPLAFLAAQEPARDQPYAKHTPATADFGKLFDAVVQRTAKSFWDKERMAQVGWEKRAAEVRQSVVDASSLEEAARRINALLAELKTSHTALLTPDDVDYYILLAILGGAGMPRPEFDARFWGAGVTYAGIGHFSVLIDGRDFVDAVLEGSPAERAGLKVGDEILAVDGAPHHPIRSFRGKVGRPVAVTVRRTRDRRPETLAVQVMSTAPLHAFREATRASARVIERDGRRIGYVHVWASIGEESTRALSDALMGLGVREWPVVSISPPPGRKDAPVSRPVPPKGLDGLIVDMRGKIGGFPYTAGRYLDALTRGPRFTRQGKSRRRPAAAECRPHRPPHAAPPSCSCTATSASGRAR